MKILLDTHALIWWLEDDQRLSRVVRHIVAESTTEVYVSSASGWEMATKARIGKLTDRTGAIPRLKSILVERGMRELPVSMAHAVEAGALPGPHRDPFDRMLIAQSRIEEVPIATIDPIFAAYGTSVIW